MRRIAAAAVLVALIAAPAARADGDPASDVLLLQDAYLPYQPAVPKAVSGALTRTLKQLHAKGFPLKVAVIASKTDLGAVPQFLGRPQPYAGFLESEIKFNKAKPLLVVMQSGFGTAEIAPNVAAALHDVDKPRSSSGDALGRAAIDAVVRLGAAAGHPVPQPKLPPAAGAGGGGTSPAIIFGVPVLLLALGGGLAAARARQRERATS